MRKVTLIIVLSILATTSWGAADQSSQQPEAVMNESTFEFQPVVEGIQVVHDFIIHNRGDAPLKILKIQSG